MPCPCSPSNIRQSEALGLGHAVLCASRVIGADEAFAVLLADDLIDNPGEEPVMRQMAGVYGYHRCSVLGTMNVPREETRQYDQFDGPRYDCGDKLGYLKATVELGLRHPEIGKAFDAYLGGRFGGGGQRKDTA